MSGVEMLLFLVPSPKYQHAGESCEKALRLVQRSEPSSDFYMYQLRDFGCFSSLSFFPCKMDLITMLTNRVAMRINMFELFCIE